MSSPPRSLAVLALAIAAAIAVVVVGRHERATQATREMNGFRIVQSLVGPLDSPSLSGFRVFPSFDCLTYRRGSNPFALELCIDHAGRVVEAIDRRTETRRIWSLRADPSASTDVVDRATVDRLLRRMGAA